MGIQRRKPYLCPKFEWFCRLMLNIEAWNPMPMRHQIFRVSVPLVFDETRHPLHSRCVQSYRQLKEHSTRSGGVQAVASHFPSGENLTDDMALVCPDRV